jgi:hypothetical protein
MRYRGCVFFRVPKIMALTDTFVRQVKHTGKPAGDKHADGGGMYLLVKAGGKYWRMDYAYAASARPWPWACIPMFRWRPPESGATMPASCWPKTLIPAPPSGRKSKPRRTRRQTPLKRWRGTGCKRRRRNVRHHATERSRLGWKRTLSPTSARCPFPPSGRVTCWTRWFANGSTRGARHGASGEAVCGMVFRYAVVTGLAERDVTLICAMH